MAAMEATLSVSGASDASSAVALAASMAARMSSTVSWPIALSSTGMTEASADFNTASAAARRTAGSGLIKVSAPTAEAMARRMRLLTLTFSTVAFGASPASAQIKKTA